MKKWIVSLLAVATMLVGVARAQVTPVGKAYAADQVWAQMMMVLNGGFFRRISG